MNFVPKASMERLILYYKYACYLKEKGVIRTSSKELADSIPGGPYNGSVVRRDLNLLGVKGGSGYGYEVRRLVEDLASGLGLYKKSKFADIHVIGEDVYQLFIRETNPLDLGDEESFFENTKPNIILIEGLDKLREKMKEEAIDILIVDDLEGSSKDLVPMLDDVGLYGILNLSGKYYEFKKTTSVDVDITSSIVMLINKGKEIK